jgi:bifunctional non-homologous end joining protein LigD
MPRLENYRAKRDFAQTEEPRGRIGRGKGRTRRFVVQRHDASRLHFDLRLELNGVYKSWAVTKIPSLDPAVKRLAVEVEDHPLDYGTFEGTIPKGQYGGGTVQLWDRGTWTSQATTAPAKDLEKGELKITLAGTRMMGGWALIRLRDRETDTRKGRRNWLLIKEKDEAARPGHADALARARTSVKTGRTLAQIAKGQSPVTAKVAKTAKTKTAKGKAAKTKKEKTKKGPSPSPAARQPRFIAPQLCRLVPMPASGGDWVHEIKFDGYRMQLHVRDRNARLLTRKGLDWTKRFPEIAADCAALPDLIADGEIVSLDKNGISRFADLQEALSTGKTAKLVFCLFDLLYHDGRDLAGEPLAARKAALQSLLHAHAGKKRRLRFVDHLRGAGGKILDEACRMGLEGIISKRAASPYRPGRNGDWTKAKCRAGQEVVIGGWWGDYRTLRALLVGVFREGQFIYLGRVGTGFNAANIPGLLKKLVACERKTPPFADASAIPRKSGVHWVKPQIIAEIEFGTITAAGLLRQASFKALREDKPARNVVPEYGPASRKKG